MEDGTEKSGNEGSTANLNKLVDKVLAQLDGVSVVNVKHVLRMAGNKLDAVSYLRGSTSAETNAAGSIGSSGKFEDSLSSNQC